MHILFVCTGNICRSPTAERLTRAYAETLLADPSQLTAQSAGTRAVHGSAMEPTAELVLRSLGGSGRGFRARQIEPDMVSAADVVLTMTRQQRTKVLNTSPRALSRTFTLREAHSMLAELSRTELAPPGDLDQRGRQLVAAMVRQRANRHASLARSDDIRDPIGSDASTFVTVGDDIAEALTGWLDVCCGLAPEPGTHPGADR